MYSDNTWMLWHTTLPEMDCFCYTHTTCDVTENGVRYIEVHREYNILKRHVIEWCCTDLMWLSIPCSFLLFWVTIDMRLAHLSSIEEKPRVKLVCFVMFSYFILCCSQYWVQRISTSNFNHSEMGLSFLAFFIIIIIYLLVFFLFFHSWFVDVSDSINEAKWFAFQSKCSSPSTMYNI